MQRDPWDALRKEHREKGTGRAALTAEVIEDSLDQTHDHGCAIVQLLDILGDLAPGLASTKPEIRGLYEELGLAKDPIPLCKTPMTALRTTGHNEAKTSKHAFSWDCPRSRHVSSFTHSPATS